MSHDPPSYEVVHLPVSTLAPDPLQPRKVLKPDAVQDLADSIRQYGILQPLVVRPRMGPGDGSYYIVAGEHRHRAAVLLGLETVPCHVRAYVDTVAAAVGLAENVYRRDLSEIEMAEAFHRLKLLTGRTWAEVAQSVRLSEDYVKRLVGLLKLEHSVKEMVRSGSLSTRVAIALKPLPPRKQIELAERAVAERLTAEQVRQLARTAPEQDEQPRSLAEGLEEWGRSLAEMRRWLQEQNRPEHQETLERLAEETGQLQGKLHTFRKSLSPAKVQGAEKVNWSMKLAP